MSKYVECSLCGGQKGWGTYPPMNTGDWIECRNCLGAGKIEIFSLEELKEIVIENGKKTIH